jgi:hypothetical protein
MLTNVISSSEPRKGKVLKLISWKHSFKRLNEEYEIAKKKKQALDNLFETGRISQATRDSFDSDINSVISEIEKQQTALLTKMRGKAEELETQVKTLETLLANYEIQHVVGEIDEEFYQREINLLSTGLESAKRELNVIKDATIQLCPPVEEPTIEPSLSAEENVADVVQTEPVETVPSAPAETEAEVATEPCPQEPVIMMEEAVAEAPVIENPYTYSAPEETTQVVEETVEEAPAVMEAPPSDVTEEAPLFVEDTPQEPACECPPQVAEDAPQEIDYQPQVTEDVPQETTEAPEMIEDSTEITEESPQISEYTSQEVEDQPEITEDAFQNTDETSEITEDNVEVQEEFTHTIEETEVQTKFDNEMQQTAEEMPQITENEPQLIEENLQTAEEAPKESHPLEAPEEAPQEISVEVVADEDQSDEETAEADEAAETDEDSEYQEL